MEINQVKPTGPYNHDAEVYVLGCVLLDNTIMASLKGRLHATDFHKPTYQKLYAVMEKLDKSGSIIDLLTVQENYEIMGYGKKNDITEELISIVDQVPNTAYIETYVEIILEKSVERLLIENLDKLKANIINNKYEYNEILDKAEKDIYEVIKLRKTSDIIKIYEAVETYYEEVLKRASNKGVLTGIDTGYPSLNKITSGFQPGEFIIIAARPSVGKTAFALNLTKNVAELDSKKVAFFSLEMSVNQIMQRMFCMAGLIDAGKVKTGDLTEIEKSMLGVARQKLRDLNIYFDESGSNTVGDIRAKCRQLKQRQELDLVIIDYLQLISTNNNKNRQEGVSEVSRSLKQLARELDIPVIALSQLSRGIETREDKRPVLADLRESGSLEQDADIVMFLFKRSDIEPEDLSAFEIDQDTLKQNKEDDNIRKIILKIEKNRQGSLGHIDFDFYGAQSRYVESVVQQELFYKKKSKKTNNK